MLIDKIIASGINDSNIYLTPNIPAKKLRNAISSYAANIHENDVILLLDGTKLGSSKEGLLITEDAIYFSNSNNNINSFKFDDITHLDINKNIFVLNNDHKCHINNCKLETINNLFYVIYEHVFKESYMTSLQLNVSDEHSVNNKGDNKISTSKIMGGVLEAVEMGATAKSKMFNIISKLDAYALVTVALLRDNAPEKVLSKLERLPGIGYAAWAAKIGLRHPLNWLNEQLIKYGEPPIMKPLVESWKNNGISSDELAIKLAKLPNIFDDTVKSEAFELLNKYYPVENIPECFGGSYNDDNDNLSSLNYCLNKCICGSLIAINAKFCPECGERQPIFKCDKCGYEQSKYTNFCPECGEHDTIGEYNA